ncbi:MgtC/SapB family protein [Chryseolinea soli]|uniref:MgtC/SapB family protein n=1 Tax=Chryseolinea soli TaxID=2321403 RepID=A0A385SHE3_9BACT|nr:MgtC/SapB family protein [Chryseolinea soli]AYB29871.1 MgtC/SapB family protein [Chryseolinea soli]
MEILNTHYETALQLLLSFVIGAAIGLEREYRSKAAGLRTMIIICLGSTLFTQVSMAIGENSQDRIASNIITGVGFLGAGVIFKDGLTVTGITTATTIWISAALGMAVGAGQYFIALVGSVVVMIVLTVFEKVQTVVDRIHHARSYKIVYTDERDFIVGLELELKKLRLGFQRKRDLKDEKGFVLFYEVYGREKLLDAFNTYLKRDERVKMFEY